MAKFSKTSLERLSTCHPDLQRVMLEVIKHCDCTILYGWRDIATQQALFKAGRSKLDGIKKPSRHNYFPALAVDAAPWPVDWEDKKRFAEFARLVLDTAKRLGVKLRWGGDWDQDGAWTDERFLDMPHFELIGPAIIYGAKLK